jgi:hypothetical protein
MLEYQRLKGDGRKFRALTGLTPKEFRKLLPVFAEVYGRSCQSEQDTEKTRQRKSGGGRKEKLSSPEQKLLFTLVYLKAYPLQVLLGEVFEMSQSRTNYWIHRLMPCLQQTLKELGVEPERDPSKFARHEQSQTEPAALIVDGTERCRQRPKDREKQALHYSGKRKTHTDKNVVIVNAKTKRVSYLSQTYAGKTHDKKVVDGEAIRYPRQAILYQDTGFQGYAPKVHEIRQPKKSRARQN